MHNLHLTRSGANAAHAAHAARAAASLTGDARLVSALSARASRLSTYNCFAAKYKVSCQTLFGPLPRSGSPAREARGAVTGAVTAAPYFLECENGLQRQAKSKQLWWPRAARAKDSG